MPLETTSGCGPIQLEPFIHQVGGHSSLLISDDATVCKPLVPRELDFYKTLTPELKEFTPEFRGVIEVHFVDCEDGFVSMTSSCMTQSRSPTESSSHLPRSRRRIRYQHHEDVKIEGHFEKVFEDVNTHSALKFAPTIPLYHNPWVLKCHRDNLKKMFNSVKSGTQKFILLENLAYGYRFPCILDLKMGTRQYGDDATPEKKRRQKEKVASTTSSLLGVRICGLQVYQVTSGRFKCCNKYYGRNLSVDGFYQGLCQFLHDGLRYRNEVVCPIIKRLRRLESLLKRQDTYRFYTSSLLIVYEGDDPAHIDQADDITNQATKSGINEENYNSSVQVGEVMEPARREGLTLANVNHDGRYSPTNAGCEGHQPKGVNVWMIDFAHSTHKDLGDSKLHIGPDNGYLFGMHNLIEAFETLWNKDLQSISAL